VQLTARFDRAAGLVEARGAAAQLCVIRDGEIVLNRSFNCTPDSLFWIFSAGKPLTAVLVHRLAERGEVDLDDPVVKYWPEFGRGGKDGITLRHVLRHRTGMPTAGSSFGDVATMANWNLSLRRIVRTTPFDVPGSQPAYQFVTYGFILGEVLRRVTGMPLPDLLRDEVLEPLGMRDTFLGLPAALWHRRVPVRARGALPRAVAVVVNQRSTRRAVIPSAGVSTTARDLATFYQGLLDGRLLGAGTLAEATEPTSEGELDRYVNALVRWSQGFQLGGRRDGPWASPLGQSNGRRAFGHNGSNCCVGWADPERGIAYAYLTACIEGRHLDIAHHAAVADAVIAAC
jgi:CubicO group peptidase (beta-lactamase class C family)